MKRKRTLLIESIPKKRLQLIIFSAQTKRNNIYLSPAALLLAIEEKFLYKAQLPASASNA